jgi:NUMOD4 motif/HNH endonuclease/Helix-turn-helix domain of resolvase
MKREIWRPIAAFGNIYQVSNLGRVRSIVTTGKWRPRIKTLVLDRYGYNRCNFQINHHNYNRKVSRLVAKAFLPGATPKATVNHKNGIKTDDRSVNLEWMTQRKNNLHARRVLMQNIGRKHYGSKLKEEEIPVIRRLHRNGMGFPAIADIYGVARATINQVIRGKTWIHVR